MDIHPTAVVSPQAELGEGVVIGAYALIEGDARIGAGTVIEPMARVHSGARIGANCTIGSFSTISGEPQDLHFDKSKKTFVEIGDNCVIREGATIHRATVEGGATKIGNNALMMANSHVAHDCVIGDNFIEGCFTAVAGHCHLADNIFLSGGVMIHQKVRIGEGVIVSGVSAASLDIPPFINVFGRNDMSGLNTIGLRRRGVSAACIADLKNLYSIVFDSDSVRKNALAAIDAGAAKTDVGRLFLDFFRMEGRHYLHPRHAARTMGHSS